MSLRTRLQEPEIVIAVGAHDPLTALIASASGMEAIYQGGYAVAAHQHGLPDIGLIGLAEVTGALERISAVVDVPVIVDGDTGYGTEPNVARTVQEIERHGGSAVQIEDQVFPKRCGHMEGKEVIAPDEMVAKVRAAVAARRRPETLIIARTDALAVTGLDDAIERCIAYAQAGADVTFVDAPRTPDDLRRIAREVAPHSRVMANMTETGRTPLLSSGELEELGYDLVIFPSSQSWLFVRAYSELCNELRERGTTRGMLERFASFDEVNELLGKARWESMA